MEMALMAVAFEVLATDGQPRSLPLVATGGVAMPPVLNRPWLLLLRLTLTLFRLHTAPWCRSPWWVLAMATLLRLSQVTRPDLMWPLVVEPWTSMLRLLPL